eukprot:TRINITY_DN18357_c0_g1_i1.p2 TRINITY_DN18357_c0_g1~~TRINITY_DN18357_c0_g1_i1.p2  ORF type:complete len:217 (+),score=70.15 TRINITY_DN18357_c0_g1_i1:84-734(+)
MAAEVGPVCKTHEEYKKLLDEKFEGCQQYLKEDDAGWTPISHKEAKDIQMWSKPDPTGGVNMVKFSAPMAASVDDVLNVLGTKDVNLRLKFNPDLASGELVEECEDIVVFCMRSSAPGFMISPRESVIAFSRRKDGECAYFYGTSVSHPKAPVGKNCVRAESKVVCFKLEPTGDHSCKLTRFTAMDPKGNLPSSIVNAFVAKQAAVITKLREVLAH